MHSEEKNQFQIAEILATLFTHATLDTLGKQTSPLTKEEKEALQRWLEEAPEHRALADRLLNPANYEKNGQELQQFNADEGWQQIRPALGEERPVRRRLFWKRNGWKVAAVLVMLLIPASYFLFSTLNTKERIAPITPGITGGELTLSNGDTMPVFERRAGENAPTIFRIDSGGIDYRTPNNHPQVAQYLNTLRTRQGMECRVTLSDGTHVYLNAESSLTYPVCFSGNRREVQMTGEAYFDVAPDKKHPFIVHAPRFDVQVTGTSFNVRTYADEQLESVTLVEGSVSISQQKKRFTLISGQHFAYDKVTGNDLQTNVDTKLYTAWKGGAFTFMGTPLKEVFAYLSKWYKFNYSFDDEKAGEVHIGAHLNRYQNMNQIIDMIERLNLVDIHQRGNTLHIRSLQ